MGVEPTTGAWEATVLPLHYGRVGRLSPPRHLFYTIPDEIQAVFFP